MATWLSIPDIETRGWNSWTQIGEQEADYVIVRQQAIAGEMCRTSWLLTTMPSWILALTLIPLSLFAFLFSLPASNPENWIYKRLFFPSCFYFLFFCSPCILCLVTLPYVSQEKTQRTGRMLSREKVGGQDKKIPLEQQFHPCPRCNHPSSVQLTRSETQLVIFNKQIGKSSNMRVRYECRLCGWKNEILPDNPDDPHQFWHEDDQKRRPSEPSG